MSKIRNAITKISLESKVPGQDSKFAHRAGIYCKVERNGSNPGQFIIWFGAGRKRYAVVDALKLEDTVFFLDTK
jgi:hypothetical protein